MSFLGCRSNRSRLHFTDHGPVLPPSACRRNIPPPLSANNPHSCTQQGTVSLSLLSGALYGTSRGVALVAVISTLGSTACYCLSWCFGRPVALAIWRDRLRHFADEVRARDDDLLAYIIFLRVTPILPNTFINVASPIVGVPLLPFFFGGFRPVWRERGDARACLWGGVRCAHLLRRPPAPAMRPLSACMGC
jgi:hypothetical protein